MAKEYFQDITPPEHHGGDRSIRNVPIHRTRQAAPNERREGDHIPRRFSSVRRGGHSNRRLIWIISGVSILVLLILIILFVFRSTSVSVVPQSQPIVFDQNSQFTAYPSAIAVAGTIPYTIQSTDFDDSEVVAANGAAHQPGKASGSISVINDYSPTPMKLLKNTRFQTSDGLIFRVPAEISVPGKHGTTPGKVTVTVVADQVGSQYDIGANTRLTLPGLKSSPAYANVFAVTTGAMTGGYSGNEPAVDPSTLDAATTKMHTRLQDKITAFAASFDQSAQITLPARVTYKDEPSTPEAGNKVRLHESVHVDLPLMSRPIFAAVVGQSVSADAAAGTVKLVPGQGFNITVKDTGAQWGTDPLTFTLSGSAQLISVVDTNALAQALAGRDEGAFQTVVSNFPGVQSASARIEPFWESKFPTNPKDIHVTVASPKTAQ